jgi:hypothetical protein
MFLLFVCVLFASLATGLNYRRVGLISATYNVTLNDDIIACDTSGTNNVVINLPPITAQNSGYAITLVDELGNAGTEAITVNVAGSETFQFSPSPYYLVLNNVYKTFYSDGVSNWVVSSI